MKATRRILRYELHNVLRSRTVLVYAALLFLLTDALFRFGGSGARVVLSLLNVVLILVPLVSAVFGTMYVYGAREFTELLLAQPVGRRSLFTGLYLGLSLPLAGAFLAGVGLPFILHAKPEAALWGPLLMLLTAGLLLTFVFTAVAVLLGDRTSTIGPGARRGDSRVAGVRDHLRRADPADRRAVQRLPARGPGPRAHADEPGGPGAGAPAASVRHGGPDGLHRCRLRAVLRVGGWRGGRCWRRW